MSAIIYIYNLTSSSPKECLLLGPGCGENLEVGVAFVETRISFVSLCILASKADLASSSCSSLDCNLTLPSSSFSYDEQTIVRRIHQQKRKCYMVQNYLILHNASDTRAAQDKMSYIESRTNSATIKQFFTFCFQRIILSSSASFNGVPVIIPIFSCSSSSFNLRISFWYFFIKDFSSIICRS